MKDWTKIRERYLRDTLPIRLSGLAANLARITSFSKNIANYDVVESLLHESKLFIEWTVGEAEIDTAATLIDLQILLARWQSKLSRMWEDPVQRSQIAKQSQHWSTQLLEMSGLLK